MREKIVRVGFVHTANLAQVTIVKDGIVGIRREPDRMSNDGISKTLISEESMIKKGF